MCFYLVRKAWEGRGRRATQGEWIDKLSIMNADDSPPSQSDAYCEEKLKRVAKSDGRLYRIHCCTRFSLISTLASLWVTRNTKCPALALRSGHGKSPLLGIAFLFRWLTSGSISWQRLEQNGRNSFDCYTTVFYTQGSDDSAAIVSDIFTP